MLAHYWVWKVSVGLLGNRRNDWGISKPELNQYLNDKHIIDTCYGCGHSLASTIDGDVYAWGRNNFGQIGTERA